MRSYNRMGWLRGIFGFAVLGLTFQGVAIGQSQRPVEHATSRTGISAEPAKRSESDVYARRRRRHRWLQIPRWR